MCIYDDDDDDDDDADNDDADVDDGDDSDDDDDNDIFFVFFFFRIHLERGGEEGEGERYLAPDCGRIAELTKEMVVSSSEHAGGKGDDDVLCASPVV